MAYGTGRYGVSIKSKAPSLKVQGDDTHNSSGFR
jgi:hypothetical protein